MSGPNNQGFFWLHSLCLFTCTSSPLPGLSSGTEVNQSRWRESINTQSGDKCHYRSKSWGIGGWLEEGLQTKLGVGAARTALPEEG